MVRNQFYILTVGVILIILLGYIYNILVFSKEISNFFSYYSNLARLIYTKKFLEIYQRFFYLDNSEVYPIKVFYNCSLNSISIENSLRIENISIFDKEFNYLPTSYDIYAINFTIFEKIHYKDNICIFEGYIVKNDNYTSLTKINGSSPIFYRIYTDKKTKINKEEYIKLINNIIKEFFVDFNEKCTELRYFVPDVNLRLNSLSLENITLYYIQKHNDILTLGIENNGKCPIDIRNFLYETDNFYKIIPNVTVNATSFLIYPGQIEIFNFSNVRDMLCLNSLGFRKCITI